MTLDKIISGAEVFIDANIFTYHFTGVSEKCSAFLSRCEREDLYGMTSANILLEVLHRLMMIEAVNKNLVKPPNIVKKLAKHPEKIKQLNEYFVNTQKIIDMGISLKPVLFESILKNQIYRLGYGLMVNDSLVAASMQDAGVQVLATNDDGFSKIENIALYKPDDVNL